MKTVGRRVRSENDLTHVLIATEEYASGLGFDAGSTRLVVTAVSELARNILKYAKEGRVEMRLVDSEGRQGIQVVVSDRGPGITDLEAAMSDHFSTSGTLGLGLPGVRRVMDEFEIKTAPDEGTRVVVRKWLPARAGRR